MKKYPETIFPRDKGEPFVVAFLFLPDGPHIYKGGVDHVRKATAILPTCHGTMKYFGPRREKKTPFKWRLFGKYSHDGYCFFGKKKGYQWFSLNMVDKLRIDGCLYPKHIEEKAKKRKVYVLMSFGQNSQVEILGIFRDLPRTHLKQLKEKQT